jgi:thymidylate kinase
VTIAPPQRLVGDGQNVTLSLQSTLESLGEQAHQARQRRRTARQPVFTVAVLGIDGSGKSTLSRRLAGLFSAERRSCLISDRLELFTNAASQDMQPLLTEALRRRIAGQAKQAKSLARYKIPKLADLLLRDRLLGEASRWYRPGTILMDGMPLLNLSAWAILYREEHFNREACAKVLAILAGRGASVARKDPVFSRFPELVRLRQLRLDHMRVPDAVVFLDVPTAVCMGRIESRGERKQVHETEAKLSKLREAYLMVCEILEEDWSLPVLVLDGDREIDQVVADAHDFARATSKGDQPGDAR